ncbi:MAG: tetratricopeptide repeat protein [Flavobacteriales bacterium]
MKYIIYILFLLFFNSVEAQNWRDSLEAARTAYSNEDFAEALKYYESAQKNAPDELDFSDEIAQSAYKAREFEKAEKVYQQGGNNKKTSIERSENYHNIGNAKMKRKDYEGAVESYKESLRQNPNDDQTRYNLSEAIRQLKNKQKQENKNKDSDPNKKQDDQKDKQKDKKNQGNENDKDAQKKEQSGDNKSKLPNKTVDRMLDKLMKQEAATKRKASGSQGGQSSAKSGKDW